jgi:hypothetical protein
MLRHLVLLKGYEIISFVQKLNSCGGNMNKTLGLIIMLNPGSSRLVDEKAWNTFVHNEYQVSGELLLDNTMESIVRVLEDSFGDLEGELTIQNLFNLRDSDSPSAIEKYKDCFVSSKPNKLNSNFPSCINPKYKDMLHTIIDEKYMNQFPWIWLAWSVQDGMYLNERRKQILKAIPQDKMVYKILTRQERIIHLSSAPAKGK